MKLRYYPLPLPYGTDPVLGQWLANELVRISEAMAQDNILDESGKEPDRPITGQIVLDSQNWTGSGIGVYARYSGVWNKLG